ncbi:helix-turn-helix domain-containing protein [Clostridium estertheticum]|uniref:Helix-turn-helix transcriptional regulator n=1 Tax=Clostridium estertheticum TaxID=238834 RepID=A0A7Y3WV26_9CLOT|nr:helix-turn-helix domain-containing protein [Clostridium estertheticum]MBU3201398.1 helix-turn-helix domain-containing protein [Clostridium estertheticum]NNU78615.1 helix-turn-helix transcriptional regulator [Clostridium estertheticum]WAG66487.1 helix-turn-helix domain-containing protein [Clostridium estertheticum]WBL47989.1 helix-turn-helix domain-containing protein [Clostridium estertheticum]
MDELKIFKALGNETRLNILLWLKNSKENFEPQIHLSIMNDFQEGVCLGSIRKKAELSQSTISGFLSVLEEAELVEIRKIGQYTYFRRNEQTIKEIAEWMKLEL